MTLTVEQRKRALIDLLQNFEPADPDLRNKVLALVPAWDILRDMGTALIPHKIAQSARERILTYFQQYPRTVISNRELMVVSGISEWARRVRELRREFGWDIVNGLAIKEMIEEEELSTDIDLPALSNITRDDYIMLSTEQDREAALRWRIANDIRKGPEGSQTKILKFLLENVGKPVSGEELRYVTKDKSEWARRTRELRTEQGWQIGTHNNGRPDLSPGMYVLESDRQLPVHDRKIKDAVRRQALFRDNHTCQSCGWTHDKWNLSDPRHLEIHHIEHHVDGGSNDADNLKTLCNICHDLVHKER